MSAGGFTGAVGFLANALGGVAAFVAFPTAYDMTWPWLVSHVVADYGPMMQSNATWVWSILLGLVLFALTRMVLLLLVAGGGFALALSLFFGRRRDR